MGEPLLGRQIGRFRVDSELGRGGMGVVFAATDVSVGRPVALKVIADAYAARDDFRRRFHREADILTRLDSPHIVTVFDHGEFDDIPYLATQLVRGGDLGTLVHSRGPMTPAAAAAVTAQVADALDDAHRSGVIHRDVKASNVLIRDPDAETLFGYLCDFGIAKETQAGQGDVTTTAGIPGTWGYLAPERINGAPASVATDLYALGCLFWLTLTGGVPFQGSDLEVATGHVSGPVPQIAGSDPLTTGLNHVLGRTLAKDGADRYPDADAMRRDLRALPAAGHPPVADLALPTTPPRPVPPPTPIVTVRSPADPPFPPTGQGTGRRRPAGIAIGAVALVAAAAVVIGLLLRDGSPSSPKQTAGPATSTTDSAISTARRSIAGDFRGRDYLSSADADCIARKMVDRPGVTRLRDAGILDADSKVKGKIGDTKMPKADADATVNAIAACTDAKRVFSILMAATGQLKISAATRSCLESRLSTTQVRGFLSATFQGVGRGSSSPRALATEITICTDST